MTKITHLHCCPAGQMTPDLRALNGGNVRVSHTQLTSHQVGDPQVHLLAAEIAPPSVCVNDEASEDVHQGLLHA